MSSVSLRLEDAQLGILCRRDLIRDAVDCRNAVASLHARIFKLGFDNRTLICNRLIDLYSGAGDITAALQIFRRLPRNTFTWNLALAAFTRVGKMDIAHHLFDLMPLKDVVTWNTMTSGYLSIGALEKAFGLLFRMQKCGVKASAFTLSIAAGCVTSAQQVKQIHGVAVRSELVSRNVVVANSFIHNYGKVGLWEYASHVFDEMEEQDMVSWNSVISACRNDGWAFRYFGLMREAAIFPDQFTMSTVISVCADLMDADKGEQAFALCFKLGCVSNSIVSSAVIDMYSRCGRLDDSIKLFKETSTWDSALCNSMFSSYATNGLIEEAQNLFRSAFREDIEPTEFTFSSILRSNSGFPEMECGTQIHSVVLKLGFSSEMMVASSLIDMYAKLGSSESTMKIFNDMMVKDLATWNTMIVGLARNGKGMEVFRLFIELQKEGIKPDRITLMGILSACCIEGKIDEGLSIFYSMQERYNVNPSKEHYVLIVNMMTQAGRLEEAMKIIMTMPGQPSASVWGVLLEASQIHRNLKLAEFAAERMIELEARSPLPYIVLAQLYGRSGRWESVARVKRDMIKRGMEKVRDCSSIVIRNNIFGFEADHFLHCGGENMYIMLRFLAWDMIQWENTPIIHAEADFMSFAIHHHPLTKQLRNENFLTVIRIAIDGINFSILPKHRQESREERH